VAKGGKKETRAGDPRGEMKLGHPPPAFSAQTWTGWYVAQTARMV